MLYLLFANILRKSKSQVTLMQLYITPPTLTRSHEIKCLSNIPSGGRFGKIYNLKLKLNPFHIIFGCIYNKVVPKSLMVMYCITFKETDFKFLDLFFKLFSILNHLLLDPVFCIYKNILI